MSPTVRQRRGAPRSTSSPGGSANATAPSAARPWLSCCKYLTLTLVGIYVLVPAVVFLFPSLLREAVFENRIVLPLFVDFEKPEQVGLKGTRNFHIQSAQSLGVWHTLPETQWSAASNHRSDQWEAALREASANQETVFVYCHGNGPTRAEDHRVELYKKLAVLNAHVISFDYRGFGDSPGFSTEQGLVDDAIAVVRWVRSHSSAPLVLWGHSLGSGVATLAASRLSLEGSAPDALILDAPFLSVTLGAVDNPLAQLWKPLPFFEAVVLRPIAELGLDFDSSTRIGDVTAPVLILHAEDDFTIPSAHGVRLCAIARQREAVTEMTLFKAERGLGHNNMYLAEEFQKLIAEFLAKHVRHV